MSNNNYKVVKIIDEYRLIVNAGTENGIEVGTVFEVVSPGDEVVDPDTGEVLGQIDSVKALLKVEHIYEKMSECVNASSPPAPIPSLHPSTALGASIGTAAAAAGISSIGAAAAGLGIGSLAALASAPFILAANLLYKRLDIDPKEISGVSEKKEPIRIGDKIRLVPKKKL